MDISRSNPMDTCQRTGTKRMLVIWLATRWIYLLPSSAPRRARRCQISLFNSSRRMSFHRVANKKQNKQHRQRQIWSGFYEMFGRVSRGCAGWSVIWDVHTISNRQDTGVKTYSRVLFLQTTILYRTNEQINKAYLIYLLASFVFYFQDLSPSFASNEGNNSVHLLVTFEGTKERIGPSFERTNRTFVRTNERR